MHQITMARERVLAREMAEQLRLSLRGFYNLKKLGLPYTQVGGSVWYEPVVVHEWLDKFNRTGSPGIKNRRNPAVLEPPKAKRQAAKAGK
jgi:hypothetical protein